MKQPSQLLASRRHLLLSTLGLFSPLFLTSCGGGSYTPPPDTTPPTAPMNLLATAVSPAEIDLAWTASTDNVGVTGYKVERCQGAACSNFAQIATPTATTFNDTGLAGSTSYSYRVRATDAAGNMSSYSVPSTKTTPVPTLTAPSNFMATAASATQINLSWSASVETGGTISNYQVERCQGAACSNFAQIATPTTTTFNDTGLAGSTSYSYRVRATDAASNLSNYSATATASTPSASLSVSITPRRGGLTLSQSLSFTAQVQNDVGSAGVTWSASNGTFTSTSTTAAMYLAPNAVGSVTIKATSVADNTQSASATLGVTDLAGVFTYHNDTSRTGANTKEYVLTTSSVNTATFGKLFSCDVDAAVYAQPLWVANLTIGGAPHNVVFVATERDSVYAVDADANSCVKYWNHVANSVNSLIPSGETWVTNSDVGCGDLVPDIGITGTPVIDPVTSTLYVITKTKNNAGTAFHQRLHALDLLTGSEKFGGPMEIQATVPGNGDASIGNPPKISFDPLREGQRPALLLSNDASGKHVVISWASHCDISPYHGWVMSYSASTLAQEAVFNTSPTKLSPDHGSLAGVWMSGNGPAVDPSGNIFFATGNGAWDGSTDFGDSIVKLGPPSGGSFNAAKFDYFTPINQDGLNSIDEDLGSGGLLLLPDIGGAHPHLLVQAGKEGKIYLLDRDNMGHILCSPAGAGCMGADTQIVQEIPSAVGGMWDSPAYWNNNLFFLGAGDVLKAFAFSASSFITGPTSQSTTGALGFPGATPSVSASGSTNGIVWLLDTNSCGSNVGNCSPGGPAILHAYNASNVAMELWNSSLGTGNAADIAVKFTVPTIANGKVYIGTRGDDNTVNPPTVRGRLDVYGLLPN